MKKNQEWHIGCSGFHYREWKGVFYPEKLPQRRWFEYYSSQFDTLELNVTFYRFPQPSFLEKWYEISPATFSFAVKVPRAITHFKQFNDCASLLDSFYGTIEEGLKEKLNAVLFQLPPKFSFTKQRLQTIIENIRPGFNNVIEFRHESWWQAEIIQELKAHNITFSGESHPSLPSKAVVGLPLVYYRFHGVPKLYYSSYSITTLKEIADTILNDESAEKVLIYFNNTAGTGAIENAVWLKNYIQEQQLG